MRKESHILVQLVDAKLLVVTKNKFYYVQKNESILIKFVSI